VLHRSNAVLVNHKGPDGSGTSSRGASDPTIAVD